MPLGWKQKFKEEFSKRLDLIRVPSSFTNINRPFEKQNLKPRRVRFNVWLDFF